MRWQYRIGLAIFCTYCATVSARELTLASGPRQTVMIELYTSEGCSSCPPAEHLLNRLVHDQRLWQTYIPLAFHVDYWDYLGWRDRFATAANSQRQRTYAAIAGAATVYTPEFFVNGREWRPGLFHQLPQPATTRVGTLQVVVDKNQIHASFKPLAAHTGTLALHVAILGMHLASQVRAGENAGRRLQHQFVVLSHKTLKSDEWHWQTALPQIPQGVATSRALVVWVSSLTNPRPLQAVGGYLGHAIQ